MLWGKHWSKEEDAILISILDRDLHPRVRVQEYLRLLPGRTYPAAINNRISALGRRQCSHRPQRRWTDEEREILRQLNETHPPTEIAQVIDRTPSSVLNERKRLKLPCRVYQKIEPTAEMDAAIREGYTHTHRGACKRLGQRFGVPAGWIKSRARKLGLTRCSGQAYLATWTAEEDAMILELQERGGAKYIWNRMRKAGYNRSMHAIENRIYHLGSGWKGRDIYNATELADAMGITSKTVCKWIRIGLLKGHKENPSGLHDTEEPWRWMIKHKDAREFLINNVNAYRLSQVNKYWFVATIADDPNPAVQRACGNGHGVETVRMLE